MGFLRPHLYEPAPEVTPWIIHPIPKAGGLTPGGLLVAFLFSIPVVILGVLLAWVVS